MVFQSNLDCSFTHAVELRQPCLSRCHKVYDLLAAEIKALPVRIEPEPTRPIPSQEEVLGRNFAAAFIATQQGIGLDYARKRYAHEPIGEFWTSLARMVIDHLANQPALPPRIPSTIQ